MKTIAVSAAILFGFGCQRSAQEVEKPPAANPVVVTPEILEKLLGYHPAYFQEEYAGQTVQITAKVFRREGGITFIGSRPESYSSDGTRLVTEETGVRTQLVCAEKGAWPPNDHTMGIVTFTGECCVEEDSFIGLMNCRFVSETGPPEH